MCTAIAITFIADLGDIPLVTIQSSLTHTGSVIALVAETRKGTMENDACSGCGTCDYTRGECRSHVSFSSSDGSGNLGVRGDCGFKSHWQGDDGFFDAANPTTIALFQ